MLDFHCDWSGKLLHSLTTKPDDGTDQMRVLREFILTIKRGLNVDGALLHAWW